jgi:hypothetical protein
VVSAAGWETRNISQVAASSRAVCRPILWSLPLPPITSGADSITRSTSLTSPLPSFFLSAPPHSPVLAASHREHGVDSQTSIATGDTASDVQSSDMASSIRPFTPPPRHCTIPHIHSTKCHTLWSSTEGIQITQAQEI